MLREGGTEAAAAPKRRRTDVATSESDIVKAQLLLSQTAESISVPIVMAKENVKAYQETIAVMDEIMPPMLTTEGPLSIPVATVECDNRNLEFDRPGVKLCAKGCECAAFLIHGPPSKPLGEYDGPGKHSGLCLLCIRMQIATLMQMHRSHGSRPPIALLPPFTNLVDTPGGYCKRFMTVTPADVAIVKGGVFIMGCPVQFNKNFSSLTNRWFVDQGAAVFAANGT